MTFNEEQDGQINFDHLYKLLIKYKDKEKFDDEMNAFLTLDKLTNGKCFEDYNKKLISTRKDNV